MKKTLDQWLTEKYEEQEIPNLDTSARKNRACMPAIKINADLISDMHKNKVMCNSCMLDPRVLKPGQRNFDLSKVSSIVDNGSNSSLDNPIIATKDGYVVDGHHRWLASVNQKLSKVMVNQLDIEFWPLIKMLKELGYPQNRDLEK